jgi:hypothetical protein
MAQWIKCTPASGDTEMFVNLENVITLAWSEAEQRTRMAFIGGEADVLDVLEKPRDLMMKKG